MKDFVRRLGELFAPKRKPQKLTNGFSLPFGLDQRRLEALRRLRTSDDFGVFLSTLDDVIKFNVEAMLTASTDESLHFHRGVVMGIRKAGTLVDEINQAEKLFLDDRRKQERSRSRDRGSRVAALYGSPGWRKPSNS